LLGRFATRPFRCRAAGATASMNGYGKSLAASYAALSLCSIDEFRGQWRPGPRRGREPDGAKTAHPFSQQNKGLLGHGPAVSFRLAFQPTVKLGGEVLYQ
jgi:hypothetical protein